MTKENCIKYLEEAKDEETKKFWADRLHRKYPEKKDYPEENINLPPEERKPKSKVKK